MTDRIRCGALAAAIALLPGSVFAEDYPTRPITDIVASTPGGGTDIISRIVGEQLAKQLGQPFVVDNIPGAGSLNGTLTAAKAAPDGYTLTTGLIASMAVNPSLFAHLPYDPVRDFEPIAMLAKFPLAKAKPVEINFASAGAGTGQHLSAELFQLLTGIKLTHVPYRGAQPAYADIMSGQVPVFFDNLASALGQIQGGNVRALAVTGTKRSPLLPDVPTVAESGVPDYQYYVWFGLWAPKKTPQPIIEKLHAEVEKALAEPDVQRRITADGGELFNLPLAEITPFVQAEIAKWADVVKRAGVTVQ